MVDLAGAEFRDFADCEEFLGGGEVAESAVTDGCADFFQFESGFVGDCDEHFSFVGVRATDHGHFAFGGVLGEGAGEGIFDCGQANHFSADFGESFESAEDGDEAAFIHLGDIAGVVPSVECLECGIGFGVEVAAHDVWAADEEAASLRDPGDGFGAPFHSRHDSAGASGEAGHWSVDADCRATFCCPVTLEDADTVDTAPGIESGFLHFFSSGEEVAHPVEVIRVGASGVAVEEGVGADEHGGALIVCEGGYDAIVERRGVEEDEHSTHEREERADGQAEAVEKRK